MFLIQHGVSISIFIYSIDFYYGLIDALNMEVKHYAYFNREKKSLDFEGLIKDLLNAEKS